jgi:hypothetical protein
MSKIVLYPADEFGCGKIRLEWPAEQLNRAGADIILVGAADRHVRITMANDHVQRVDVPDGVEVVVFQRVTHSYIVEAISHLRARGIAVVVDIDDDLAAIDPNNPAWSLLHPEHIRKGQIGDKGQPYLHSWLNTAEACKRATLVTVSTPGLLARYAAHGRGHVLSNYLADHYYHAKHLDSARIVWPAALHSHPNDPATVGSALNRLISEGADFGVVGPPNGVGRAFGLLRDPEGHGVPIDDYPAAVAEFGIGICPLADTLFNSRKSWLKPLELSACGVPWVASPRAEYVKLHRYGAGMMAQKPKDWYRQLHRLIKSAALREELSEAGQQIAAQLSMAANAWRYLEAWERAVEIERSAHLLRSSGPSE